MLLNLPFEANGGLEANDTYDYSGYDHHGTVNGADWNRTGSFDGFGEYRFNSSNNDEIIISNSDFDMADLGMRSAFSVEAWVKKRDTSISWTNTYGVAMWNTGSSPGTNSWNLGLTDGGSNDEPKFSVEIGTTTHGAAAPFEMTLGEWYHLVGTYDNETLRLYVNGTEAANNTVASGPVNDNNRNLRIANKDGTIFSSNIDVALVRIYNRTLSPEQIGALYQNRTDLIVSQETSAGDVWQACITPNDGYEDGLQHCSNNLTVLEAPVLNCPVIDSAVTYTMNNSFAGAPNSASPHSGTACVKINASNVVFDCNGYSITNNGTGGTTYGILLTSADNVTLKNCPSLSGYTYGLDAYNSDDGTFTDITAHNNDVGVQFDTSNVTNATDIHTYNNTQHASFTSSVAGNTIAVTNLMVDNSLGNMQNYTSFDLVDTFESGGQAYNISWATNSSALPSNYTSFWDKFVEISNISGAVSIDQISWTWNDAESLIYNESQLQLWKWNGTNWSDTGAALNAGANSLTLSSMNPASTYGILQNGTIGQAATLEGAQVNETEHARYNESGFAGNATTAGGNFTNLNVNTSQLTERWSALYGTFDGSILLTDLTGASNIYSWIWNATAGGVVCVSTNNSLYTFTVFPASASDIDSAWSFTPTAPDSAVNTFDQTNCTLDLGATSIANATYADTGSAGGYITCAIKTVPTPAKSNIAFCADIEEDGPIWNGDSGDFEVIVPTPTGAGTTETYYFYVNLD